MTDLEIRLKEDLDNYLEFDSDLLFKNTDFLVVFGGAVRDSIAEYPKDPNIHDVDILCMSVSYRKILSILDNFGYEKTDLVSRGLFTAYDVNHTIFEPHTYINKHKKVIQFIRPCAYEILKRTINITMNRDYTNKTDNIYFEKLAFFKLLSNVDLSCCGVFWNGKTLYESIPNSINHCLTKRYQEYTKNIMTNPKRIMDRKFKLQDRGWKEITPNPNAPRADRIDKLNEILTDYPQVHDFEKYLNFDSDYDDKVYEYNNKHNAYKYYSSDELPF